MPYLLRKLIYYMGFSKQEISSLSIAPVLIVETKADFITLLFICFIKCYITAAV